jgi:hypothetical protein
MLCVIYVISYALANRGFGRRIAIGLGTLCCSFLRSLQDQIAVLAASLVDPNIEKGPAYATRNSKRVMLGCHSLPVGEYDEVLG